MNETHPAFRAALRIDTIAAEFWRTCHTPSAGNRLRQIARIIEEESRIVDAKPDADGAMWALVRSIEEDDHVSVIRARTRELKEALRK